MQEPLPGDKFRTGQGISPVGGERTACPEATVQRLLIGSGRWWGLGDYVGLVYSWCTEKFAEEVVSDRMKVVPWALEDWKRHRLGGS